MATVLIVEDNQDSREALASYLRAQGIRCLTAANTLLALECLNREAGTALVLVTHDPALAAKARRVVTMSGGKIVAEGENSTADGR